MDKLKKLHKLVNYQQFAEIKTQILCDFANEDNLQLLPLLSFAYIQLGEQEKALKIYEQVANQESELSIEAQIDLAGVDCVLMRIDKATKSLESILQRVKTNSFALARLAWCRIHQNDIEEARQLYKRALDIDGDKILVWFALIRLELQADNIKSCKNLLPEAINCFMGIEEKLPDTTHKSFVTQFENVQLEIWVAEEQFSEAEQYINEKADTIKENEWAGICVFYSTLLAGKNFHPQAIETLHEALKRYAENSILLLQLAELAQIQGHFMQAMNVLKKAISLDKDNPALWCKLSSVCLHRFDQQARGAAEKAIELVGNLEENTELPLMQINNLRLQAKNGLAQVESHEQNYDKATELFNEVLMENEYFIPALQGLGQQYMQQGKINEALELYERVKMIDPLKAQMALINARHYPEDEKTLERMEQAAKRPSIEGDVRAGILFQVAMARAKRQDYDKAFDILNKANYASRNFLNYDGKEHRKNCARLRHFFNKDLFEHRKECGIDSTLPVYVLGMPRSGTTLVEQILSGHSEIFGAGELGVIPQRVAGLERWERHVGSGRHYPACIDDLTPEVTAGIAKSILEELQSYDKKAKHIIDKLPHNFENIGLIKFFFPNAKIISVRRDPRDIAISNYFTDYQAKHGGMGFAYDLTDIGEQLADHNLLMHHWSLIFPGEILEINYEDIVDDLEGSAKKMLDYIGVEWQPKVLKFNELERPVKTASVWQVRQPIYKTSKAKWKKYEKHLAPLIQGTNARIEWEAITDGLVLPVPGFLQTGIKHYHKGELDKAELSFKKMLHHNPGHAACNYMVGLVYCSINNIAEGILYIENALKKCPWQKEWVGSLLRAYDATGETDKYNALKEKTTPRKIDAKNEKEPAIMVNSATISDGFAY
ncbi:MAG: sulfotransferase [Desulfotalea sp.]